MLIRAMGATSRTCNNPCVNKPNSVCTYVADLKRHQCICPLSMCGRDCNQICKDGRHCEYDATNDVNECKCHVGFDGPMRTVVADCLPRDCIDLKCHGLSGAVDGPHTIYPNTENLKTLQVSCDQTKNDGGWMVFQRRSEEGRPVRFDGRSWHDYKHGFGDHGNETTELWLGNENLVELLDMYPTVKWELLIEAYAHGGSKCTFTAPRFGMQRGTSNEYAMYWDSASANGAPKRYLNDLKNKPFRTNDHRGISSRQDLCFQTYSAGWWYSISGREGDCHEIFLNGPHQPRDKDTDNSIYVKGFDEGKPLKGSVMLIRAMDATSRTCNNPCVNKPNSVCTYVADLKRHQCICAASMCGRDCNQIGKDGRHCEYDATNDVNECKCHVGFDGPMCTVVADCLPRDCIDLKWRGLSSAVGK